MAPALLPPIRPSILRFWRHFLQPSGLLYVHQVHRADPPLTAASGFCVWSDTCLISTLKVVALPQAYSMQSQESGVHYSRWDSSSRDEVSVTAMSSSEEASCYRRISQKLCSGKLGIAMKVLGGVALFWIIFILGYITGYYVHKCK
ncbi:small integral membrane protein 1 isoform X1 [Mastomys coucha]|uniref:small integral membrane protein 1 isoform X1 n=2 Tax=Murinae TaxID=39107 RepID=UPI001261CBDC|nr:small integral membrane protein 1 isoform X1 [Mastomys coucha]